MIEKFTNIISGGKNTFAAIKRKLRIIKFSAGGIMLVLSVLMIIIGMFVAGSSYSKLFDSDTNNTAYRYAIATLVLRVFTVFYAFFILIISDIIKNKKLKKGLYLSSIILKIANVISIFAWGFADNILWGLISIIPILISLFALIVGVILDYLGTKLQNQFAKIKERFTITTTPF